MGKQTHRQGLLAKLREQKVKIGSATNKEIRNALKGTILPKANIREALKIRRQIRKRKKRGKK